MNLNSMEFEAIKQDLIRNVMVSNYKDEFYSNAELNIDGYIIKIPDVHYPTIDEAVHGIKERIIEAVLKFKPTHNSKKSL